MTHRIQTLCDSWLELQDLSDQQIARVLSEAKLDVIIDLGGYTGESRLGALVYRPAAVQLSYLGYFAPTYLTCIDGWIGDKILFKNLDQEDIASKPIKLNGGYMAYPESDKWPNIKLIQRRKFRFGCFNNSRKLNDQTIDLFTSVLEAVPEAEIVLKSITFVEDDEIHRIKSRFVSKGISEDRIIMLRYTHDSINHLESYEEMDVALDPIPYGGATTTCEALSMGVPVICIAGEGMVGNLSASLVHYCGHKEWIADKLEEYILLAKTLATKGVRGMKERKKLRKELKKSELGKPKRVSKELEDCILRAYNKFIE